MALGESPKSFFKKNFCVVATGGTLCIGEVKMENHELFFEKGKEVCLTLKKLSEFKTLLRTIGRSFVGKNTVTTELIQTEIAPGESIFVKDKVFGKLVNEEKVVEIEFDPISYITFLFSVRDICLFICHPSKIQYNAMIEYHNAAGSTLAEKITEVIKKNEYETPMQQFMLEQFLKLNFPVIDFYSDVRQLLEGRK